MQDNRARDYDPHIGRWLAQDPIGLTAGDGNLYGYVHNGPTLASDPSGLAKEPVQSSGNHAAIVESKDHRIDGALAAGRATFNGDKGITIRYVGTNPSETAFIQMYTSSFQGYPAGNTRPSQPGAVSDPLNVVITNSAGSTRTIGGFGVELDHPPGSFLYDGQQATGLTYNTHWMFDSVTTPSFALEEWISENGRKAADYKRLVIRMTFYTYLAYKCKASTLENTEILGRAKWTVTAEAYHTGAFGFWGTRGWSISKDVHVVEDVSAGPQEWESHRGVFLAQAFWIIKQNAEKMPIQMPGIPKR
jgi:hypothetical protein